MLILLVEIISVLWINFFAIVDASENSNFLQLSAEDIKAEDYDYENKCQVLVLD